MSLIPFAPFILHPSSFPFLRLLLEETHRCWREGTGMRMGRGQVRTLLAGNTGKVFRRMGEGCSWAATRDARGVADEEARSRKAREGICGEVTMTCSRFMFLLCKTFQACAVATTKSGV